MRVLGVAYGHNATICLMEDGKITFCQSEERINRIKNSDGFPFRTLQYVYENVCSPTSIDLAVLYETSIDGYVCLKKGGLNSSGPMAEQSPHEVAKHSRLRRRYAKTEWAHKLRNIKRARIESDRRLQREAEAYFAEALGLERSKIKHLDHHFCHAYSVVPNVSEWGKALILTLDGEGDGLCATVSLIDHGALSRISASDRRHSLGHYYCDTVRILGMTPLEDEGKVMGLAAYAKPNGCQGLVEELRRLITVDTRGQWKSSVTPASRFDALADIYRFHRFDNIAGAIQRLTEELIARWTSYWVANTGCRNVALTGGLFLNVKASQRVAELAEVERLFVMPSAGDESCSVGAAVWGTLSLDPSVKVRPLDNLDLGTAVTENDIAVALATTDANSRYQITTPVDINYQVARLLAGNNIVARCAGRMEFGARALGNRSILANPSDPLNARRINEAVKNRDFWMPFAPSILEEDMIRYVRNPDRVFAPYMSVAFDSTAEAQRDLSATIHPKDLTLRPQAVRREWNVNYYETIRSFKELTGIGAVLNTSFNLHGEPIVCSAIDAIRTVDQSGLNYLVLGKHLLRKRIDAAK